MGLTITPAMRAVRSPAQTGFEKVQPSIEAIALGPPDNRLFAPDGATRCGMPPGAIPPCRTTTAKPLFYPGTNGPPRRGSFPRTVSHTVLSPLAPAGSQNGHSVKEFNPNETDRPTWPTLPLTQHQSI